MEVFGMVIQWSAENLLYFVTGWLIATLVAIITCAVVTTPNCKK